MLSLNAALAHVNGDIDRRFDELLAVPDDPSAKLSRAMRHATIGCGKRLRALLVFATADLLDVDPECAGRVALAIECVHTYALIHHDLPAIDNGDCRGGRPAVHKIYDDATAILAGDCLHALAFEILGDPLTHPDPSVRADLVLDLARAAGPAGMVGGQVMDLEAGGAWFDLNTVTRWQALKTGALIGAAVEACAIAGHVPAQRRMRLRGYARDIGLAFQIADDLLDGEGEEELAGRNLRMVNGGDRTDFRSQLDPDRARAQARMLTDQAISHLHIFGQKADLLRAIARHALERDC